jgi:hypothetical protein
VELGCDLTQRVGHANDQTALARGDEEGVVLHLASDAFVAAKGIDGREVLECITHFG